METIRVLQVDAFTDEPLTGNPAGVVPVFCRRFPAGPIQAVLMVREASRYKLIADVTVLDREGTVLAQLNGYEAVMEDRLIRAFKPERYAAAR